MGRSPSPLPVAGYSYIRTPSLFTLCNKSQPEKYSQQARTCGVSACQSVQTSQYTQGPAKKDACVFVVVYGREKCVRTRLR